MCLAIPARIVSVEGETATADFGGVSRSISIAFIENVTVGDYVIVHTGYAIQKLDAEEAEKTLDLWREILDVKDEPGS